MGSEIAVPDARCYVNRQVSWIDFNRRVTELASDRRLPLLERLRFLAIAGENLDGFFMKRVGALKREVELGVPRDAPWPLSAAEELAEVLGAVREMQAEHVRILSEELRPALAQEGIRLADYRDLSAAERDAVDRYFEDELFPILTPLAVDPGRPFPFISNLSLSLAVVLGLEDGAPLFARVKVPANRPRWVAVSGGQAYVPCEQVIASHLDRLFRDMTILSAHPFRVTRSADVPRDDAAADDLLDFAVDLVRERRFAPVVRLEIEAGMPIGPRELLLTELALDEADLVDVDGLLGQVDLKALAALDRPELRRPPWVPVPHPRLPARGQEADPAPLFEAIAQRDILVHHPYHDYDQTVVSFVEAAVRDPRVLAIKQSLYRTSPHSPTLEALIRGAEAGKEVTALLELKARLDEEANIAWAQRLERSGIHTSYGFAGFKTHTRMTLVVREEPDGLRRYVHIGTGDYNDTTARYYSDLGLFTASPPIAAEVAELFNFLTGYAEMPDYQKLVVAPTDMRARFIECIEKEMERGANGRVRAMMNALVDVPLAEALLRASQAGVAIDLIIRGECCLVPGIPGLSDNLRVRSVLGPFLEHCRVFEFGQGEEARVYIGSADWMYRNLDHRIEVVIPVEDSATRTELSALLDLFGADTATSWELGPDRRWTRTTPAGEPVSAQEVLMRRASAAQHSIHTSSPSITTS